MDKNLENDITQATKDHKKYQEEYEKAKSKSEKLMENLESLQQKTHVLESSLKQHKKNTKYYTRVEQDIDKKQVTTFQQQNKAALATAFSEKVLNEYRDKLSEEAAGPSGAQASSSDQPSTSVEACHNELNSAIEDNRKKLLEILEKIEDLKK